MCLHTALKATDDPDMRNGINYASGTWWHVWDEWGSTYGGAPEAVAVWFRRVEVRRRAGNRCGASRALAGHHGAHAPDVAQPMHTDGRLPVEESVDSAFEQAVDDRCDISSCRYRAHQDGFDRGPAFARTLAVARAAHRFYGSLVRTFADNGYSPRVDRITRKQLNRAANAMSDLIRSM